MIFASSEAKTGTKLEVKLLPMACSTAEFETSPELRWEVQRLSKKGPQIHYLTHNKVFY